MAAGVHDTIHVTSEPAPGRVPGGAGESWGYGWLYRRGPRRPLPWRLRACSACFSRARFWRLRPNRKSTPSTTQTSRKPQKIETPLSIPPNGSATSWMIPQPSASSAMTRKMISRIPRDPQEDARARGRRHDAHEAEGEQLPVGGRGLAELLGRGLEIGRAALGQRQRRLGHAAQLQPLLRAGGGDRGAEVLARALRVHPLGGARAEDRLRRGAEARLGLELLVGAALELLHRGER